MLSGSVLGLIANRLHVACRIVCKVFNNAFRHSADLGSTCVKLTFPHTVVKQVGKEMAACRATQGRAQIDTAGLSATLSMSS